ncbi:MAG: universal stress protein, partial [Syntrophobacteria bacterium]
MIEYKNILYCSDFSEEAEMAFHHAVDFCQRYSARLHLLHVLHSGYKYMRHVVDEYVDPNKKEQVVDE